MKPKYRVVKRDGAFPYKVERKTFIFWHEVDQESSLEDAKESMIRRCKVDNKIPSGTVLATYSVDDLLIDKLKGKE